MLLLNILSLLAITSYVSAGPLTIFSDPGGPCKKESDCYGGAKCCSQICVLGSCRMDGSCDADNDCYGWCHNTPGTCNIKKGQTEGRCVCDSC
ncbi:unnamed protein product [Periconia digitata]|uniref:Uncharacterized protein n=1 Tax=Periconia digitata TaxID=1303443 RepID=A0A9W4XJF5_9PLEO|nr:unnamed protein product [Periconia digitata]